jgi:hypothetical protein
MLIGLLYIMKFQQRVVIYKCFKNYFYLEEILPPIQDKNRLNWIIKFK